MLRHPLTHRRTAWLAILALLASALLPGLSKAFASSAGTAWVQVCTAQGTKWVPVATAAGSEQAAPKAGSKLPLSAHGALDHCPYCTLADPAPALPPAERLALAPPESRDAVPAIAQAIARGRPAGSLPQARAPPAPQG